MAFLNEVGLAYFKSKLDTAIGTTQLVHNKGTLTSASQLPVNPSSGDVYYVTGDGAFYAYMDGAWRVVHDSVAITIDSALSSSSINPVQNKVIDSALANKADSATTLAGYGIADAYISSGTITLGSASITPLTTHQDISGKADKATTLAGYGIADAYISNGTITLGSASITPLTTHQDISGKADKATTLAGYGIADAYISNGTITLGSDSITPITSHQDLSAYVLASSLSPVATSGAYSDLTGTPTNHVTTDTDQNITGVKTFVGQKRLLFKQSGANDKLGFTLFDRNSVEVGYLEYNPASSGKIDGVPVMTLGNYATAAAGLTHVGFRRYSSISGESGAYNLLTPLIADAKTPFNLTTTYTNFYLPLGVTNGATTVVTAKSGLLDISTLLPDISGKADASALADYLPLAGGTMTGSILTSFGNFITKTTDTGYLRFQAGTNSDSSHRGANLLLYGPEATGTAVIGGVSTSLAGVFYLNASNTNGSTSLIGVPGGRVYWGNNQLAYVSELSAYLPLAGGTESGAITFSLSDVINRSVDTQYIRINGGTAGDTGANLVLWGPSHSTNPGCFRLRAKNSTTNVDLVGKPDGTLTWNSVNIALATDLANYLPLSGGTMTGDLTRYVDASRNISIFSQNGSVVDDYFIGWNAAANGGRLHFFGANYTANVTLTNGFRLYARQSSSTQYTLTGRATDGILEWTGDIDIKNVNPYLNFIETDVERGVGGGTATTYAGIYYKDKNGDNLASIIGRCYSNRNQVSIFAYTPDGSSSSEFKLVRYANSVTLALDDTAVSLDGHTHSNYADLTVGNKASTGNWLYRNVADSFLRISGGNAAGSGSNILLYGQSHSSAAGNFYIYANDGTSKLLRGRPNGTLQWDGQTIQTSSDERLKTAFSSVPDDVLDAWGKVDWQQFKFRDSVAEKGEENCRWHPGLVAQRVRSTFEAEGLDACVYGILCYDEWGDEYDEDGTLIREAGDLWTIRYEEAQAMEAAYQRRRADRLEQRVEALENWIADFMRDHAAMADN